MAKGGENPPTYHFGPPRANPAKIHLQQALGRIQGLAKKEEQKVSSRIFSAIKPSGTLKKTRQKLLSRKRLENNQAFQRIASELGRHFIF